MQRKLEIKNILWSVFSITIGVFSVYAIVNNKDVQIENTALHTEAQAINAELNPIPLVANNFYFIKNGDVKPNVLADAYFVGDIENGNMILQKNENKQFPIASVSKLMTATVSLENLNQKEITQISKKALATYGQNGGFTLNEKIKLSDLLYPLLLESSNDAAEAIAMHSKRDEFIQKMNDKAKELGLVSTSFMDPSGLSPGNKSTAQELFKLTKYIKEKDDGIFQITKKQSYVNTKHSWSSNNQFIRDNDYEGGKSGYTDPALQTVVSTFKIPLGQNEERHIAITLLHTPDRNRDVQNILKYLKKNVYYGKEIDAESDWVKQKQDNEPSYEQDFVNLAFVGDIMLDRGVKSSVRKNFGGDYSDLFNNLEIIKHADIAFANLEGPASDKGKDMHNLYSFRMEPSVIPAIGGAGFDVISVANNHVGDWGRDAYSDTLDRLKENEILYAGGGKNITEAQNPVIVEKYGMKIGYLAFSDKGPDWMTANYNNPGLLLASDPNFDLIVQKASKQVDYLIVSFHFGEEYQKMHNVRQSYLAHSAIDDGAKIVIGAHPHVIEDFEVYKKGYIAYSLGNFIFDQKFSVDTMQGMLLEIKLDKSGEMQVTKNIIKLNYSFQPDKIIKGKAEKIKFE